MVVLFSITRETRENAELEQHRGDRPKIQQRFTDSKRGLSVVTDQEWENIPEVGNLIRKKRRKDERSLSSPTASLWVTEQRRNTKVRWTRDSNR